MIALQKLQSAVAAGWAAAEAADAAWGAAWAELEAAWAEFEATGAAREAAAEKAEKEKNLLTSDAVLQHMWALTQGSSERDAIAAMRTFIGATLR